MARVLVGMLVRLIEVVVSLDPSISGRDRALVESLMKMIRYKVRVDGSEVIGIPSTS